MNVNEDGRRVPVQARSKARVQRILDAAALEFSEKGFASTTTVTIAKRAGTSVGSLYQFFGDKEKVFVEVAHHAIEEYEALIMANPPDLSAPSLGAIIRHQLGLARRFRASNPGFRALVKNLELYSSMQPLIELLDDRLSRHIEVSLGFFLKDASEAGKISTILFRVFTGFLFYADADAAKRTSKDEDELFEEFCVMVEGYLTPKINQTLFDAQSSSVG